MNGRHRCGSATLILRLPFELPIVFTVGANSKRLGYRIDEDSQELQNQATHLQGREMRAPIINCIGVKNPNLNAPKALAGACSP
jgi:hypothetical protein